MRALASKGRKVKSGPAAEVADRHERAKNYLSPGEVAGLLDAAKAGRHGVRDHLLLLMTYRHGLRVSEAVGIRRDELDLDRGRLWVHRLRGGLSVEQPIAGDELRPSSDISPPAPTRCPGCSSPNADPFLSYGHGKCSPSRPSVARKTKWPTLSVH
jgi:integrase